MSGWLKRKDGEAAVEPVKVRTKVNKAGNEVAAVFDAEGDEVYGGTWGDTTETSPFPQGSVPAREATIQDVYDLLVRKLGA